MPCIDKQAFDAGMRPNKWYTLWRPRPETGPVLHDLRLGEGRQQLQGGGNEFLTCRFCRSLIESDIFHCTAHEDVSISAGNHIAPLIQQDSGQQTRTCPKKNHLPPNRLNRQRPGDQTDQLRTPGTTGNQHLIRQHRTLWGIHTHGPVIAYHKACHTHLLSYSNASQLQAFTQCCQEPGIYELGYLRHPE
jgi:hypothetical protein